MDEPLETERLASPAPRGIEILEHVTAAQVLAVQEINCKIESGDTLASLASALASTGRTAMAVTDEHGKLMGLATQNDIIRAYFDGAPPHKHLGAWLETGKARAPAWLLRRLRVRLSTSLATVAEQMVSNALSGNCACHHVVVEEEDGRLCGVISSHDLVAFSCRPIVQEGFPRIGATPHLMVNDAMKHRDCVFTCRPNDTISDALYMLLATRQNSILVMDKKGIQGIFTPRVALKAFAEGINNSTTLADWFGKLSKQSPDQAVKSGSRLVDAASLMIEQNVDHLLVLEDETTEVIGVLSSLDFALCGKPQAALLHSVPLWKGPTVGQVLSHRSDLSDVCPAGTTLGKAAELLFKSGGTSALIALSTTGTSLLTENDMVRTYLDTFPWSCTFDDWLSSRECDSFRVPEQLRVPTSMQLTDAALLMARTRSTGHDAACHHLVVEDPAGGLQGVFSALDVARTLHSLCSQFDLATIGADKLVVDSVMKPIETVPSCNLEDSIASALRKFELFGQNAVLVIGADGRQLITPRCAIQAMAKGMSQHCSIAAWLRCRHSHDGPREITRGSRLLDAAAVMALHSLHHLLVVEVPVRQFRCCRRARPKPVGVLSALDVVRGLVSISFSSPFMTMGWLRSSWGPGPFRLQSPQTPPAPLLKRPASCEEEELESTALLRNRHRAG
eukprot:TRINITY_DN45542_c0_g1_i1.p1 TRINITY_DN45542_c0_g1~~TRINITY_DN45542_c0_g1_i1.p1  ORF type:complete len:676 (+),score=103.51 TRINITY_DN45542_c0_g1_i1:102-2129(+)